MATRDLTPYQDAMRWALAKYGDRSAADLELLSTIVHADPEASQAQQPLRFAEWRAVYSEIKPQFSEATILQTMHELPSDGLLVAAREHE